jgi:hypothetical protein
MALTQDQINNARSRLDNKKYETTMKFGLMGKPPKKVKPSDDQPGMLSSVADWAVNLFSSDEVKPTPQASASIWDNLPPPPSVDLVTEGFMSRQRTFAPEVDAAELTRPRLGSELGNSPTTQNNAPAYDGAVLSALGVRTSGDATPIINTAPAAEPVAKESIGAEGPAGGAKDVASDERPALKVDNSNARTSGTGLMANTKGFETKKDAVSFIRDFVDLMGDLESTEDHVDSAGTTTLAYGILPTTAAGLGIDPTDYPDRKSFARAVYSKMYDEAKVKQAATFNAIPKDKHGSVMALYANVGEAGYNKLETVKGHLENNNLPSAGTALTQIVLYSQRDDDGKKVLDANGQPIMFASKGLSARRAKEYNILMSKEPGFKKVRTVTVSIKNNKPTFKWLDADRNVVKSYTAPAPLSADNDTTDQPI